ncbi:DsbC family protein (plasmid) [Burkholderia thailandensis]|uniref:DsbC family protein n=1 Tax=Burkholderia thailandensis TaxID=57975 RepID=UPI00192DA69F|nr:DsbC family protein [Burkholderia thailandensis]MBS2132344.1 DsbC family protein [Burkholderia thailandensis]QRA15149.1 DsbC family protein [Burkholderia thailandensis]
MTKFTSLSVCAVALFALSACSTTPSTGSVSKTAAGGADPVASSTAAAPTPVVDGVVANPAQDPGVAALTAALKARYPKTSFRQVSPTPSTGIYQVVMGKKIAYTDVTGRYFLFGHLFDMVTQQDLTVPDEQALQKVEFPGAYLKNAFVEVHGNGSRKLAIFDDPDCPYCLALEAELAQVKDVTIYRFLYPLESIHPRAKAHSIAIWCADDRLATWKAWMPLALSRMVREQPAKWPAAASRMRTEPKLASCRNPVDENEALAASMGVNGTPTLISADGRVMPGAATADAIDKWLEAR